MNTPFLRFVALASLLVSAACPARAAQDPADTAGLPLQATWEYSADGGKTFSPKPPTVSASGSPANNAPVTVARAVFSIDDPAAIGALKLLTGGDTGALALTDANSVDRFNIGNRPVLTMTNLVLNGKPTASCSEPCVLYRYLTIDPAELVKGANTLTVTGVFWFKAGGPAECSLRFETIPANRAILDRLPVLGPVGTDYVTLAARAVVPSTFSVSVQPIEPAGPETKHSFDRGRQLKARVPLPAGTKRFRYSVTVQAGGASKTYGPYAVTAPTIGEGFRFVVAGNTAVYLGHFERLEKFLHKVLDIHPDVFIHMGKYVDSAPWDWMWTDLFFGVAPETLARIPVLPVCGLSEMISPVAQGNRFYYPPDDKDSLHWTIACGNVRFVALEAWTASHDRSQLQWLDKTLADAKEDYVVYLDQVVTHCSTPNAGRAIRPIVDFAAKNIDPILVKHRVTVAIGGHHTGYERVEPPPAEGVPTIMTCMAGGSGKPLHKVYVDQNKDSKFAKWGDSYCLFEVKKDKLVLQTFDFDGKVIDTREYLPRNR